MTDDMITLGKRATACKGWRWMPGMVTLKGSRIYEVVLSSDECYGDAECHEWLNDNGWGINHCDYHRGRPLAEASCGHVWLDRVLPDLTDPATLGCILALVREAYPPTQFMQDEWEMTGVPFPMHGGCDWEVRRACFDGDEKLQIDGTWGSGWPLSERVTGESEAEVLVAALEAAP